MIYKVVTPYKQTSLRAASEKLISLLAMFTTHATVAEIIKYVKLLARFV